MLLVDTAIWVDHIRKSDDDLERLLDDEMVLVHPFVVGEIALGLMKNLDLVVARLRKLPAAPIVKPDEVIALVKKAKLQGSGIGYVDAHLLASTLLTPGTKLWTRDRRLQAAAQRLAIAAP